MVSGHINAGTRVTLRQINFDIRGSSPYYCRGGKAPPVTVQPGTGEFFCAGQSAPDAEVFFNYQINEGQYVLWGHAKVPLFGKSEKSCQIRASGRDFPARNAPYGCSATWTGNADTSYDPGVDFKVELKPTKVVTDPKEQADLIKRLCGTTVEEGACRYLPISFAPDLSAPAVQKTVPAHNCSQDPQTYSKQWSHTTAESNSLGGSVRADTGFDILGQKVKVSAQVSYGHTWQDSRTETDTTSFTVRPNYVGVLWFYPVYDQIMGDVQLVDESAIYQLKNVNYQFPTSSGKQGEISPVTTPDPCDAPKTAVCLPADQSGGAPICAAPVPAQVDEASCLTDGFVAGSCPPPAQLSDLGVAWPPAWAATGGQEFVHWDEVVQAAEGQVRPRTASCPPGSSPAGGASGARRESGNDVSDVTATAGGWSYTVPPGTGRYQFWGVCTTTGPATSATAASAAAFDARSLSAAARTGARTIYVSLPLLRNSDPAGRAMAMAAELALRDYKRKPSAAPVRLRLLSDADPRTGAASTSKARANARRAAADPTAIGYLGDANSATTAAALPILNRAGLLAVGPSSTAVDLTASRRFRPSGRRTFARVVPNDLHQAAALARSARDASKRRVFVIDDREVYGRGLARLFALSARKYGLRVVGTGVTGTAPGTLARRVARSRAQGVLFAGLAENQALPILRAVAAANPNVILFGGDGLVADERFIQRAAGAGIEARLRLVSPALPPDTLGPQGAALFQRLWALSFRRPDPYAVNAYEAMRAMLDAAARASGSNTASRAATVRAFFATKRRRSPLGVYSITRSGDTTLARYADYRIVDGRLAAPTCLGC